MVSYYRLHALPNFKDIQKIDNACSYARRLIGNNPDMPISYASAWAGNVFKVDRYIVGNILHQAIPDELRDEVGRMESEMYQMIECSYT